MASAVKKIRLEQKAMPVSSEEELNLIILREQNLKLSNNYNHRLKVEEDLIKKIKLLEDTARKCEDQDPDHKLSILNQDLRERIEDLEFELNKSRLNERRLADDLDRVNREFTELRRRSTTNNQNENMKFVSVNSQAHIDPKCQQNSNSNSSTAMSPTTGPPTTSDDAVVGVNQVDAIQELETKLQDQSELANTRLKELELLNGDLRDAMLTIERLKTETKYIPREVITESSEFKTLQSHFSVLYNEATQLKTQLLESKALIMDMKNAHARQIERMQHDEMKIQKELRTNIVDLEQSLADARNQQTMFRLQYENAIKQCEQTVKMDTELKKSLSSYKIQVQQKNNELSRLKRILEEHKRTDKQQNSENKATAEHLSSNSTNSVSSNDKGPTSVKKMNDYVHQLQSQLAKLKSEEEALMQDLDVTGQAYEDMQEQNHRLLQQLEEKDDANFKLMSEHLKTNAFQKHLNEEKAQMEVYRDTLLKRIAAQDTVVKNLEEKVHLLQENTKTLEKEIEMRVIINDSYKQEKLDLKQQLVDIQLERNKVLEQMDSIQKSNAEKTANLTHELFKNRRLMEELDSLRTKYERASKLQSATTPDEVLMEEIREYKEQLTCPSCKTKPKDTVLTKCFHVFCFDCLKTRVDTRQRKCPKCNAQFGANDFHRLYLA